jgi:hypothetical protein
MERLSARIEHRRSLVPNPHHDLKRCATVGTGPLRHGLGCGLRGFGRRGVWLGNEPPDGGDGHRTVSVHQAKVSDFDEARGQDVLPLCGESNYVAREP